MMSDETSSPAPIPPTAKDMEITFVNTAKSLMARRPTKKYYGHVHLSGNRYSVGEIYIDPAQTNKVFVKTGKAQDFCFSTAGKFGPLKGLGISEDEEGEEIVEQWGDWQSSPNKGLAARAAAVTSKTTKRETAVEPDHDRTPKTQITDIATIVATVMSTIESTKKSKKKSKAKNNSSLYYISSDSENEEDYVANPNEMDENEIAVYLNRKHAAGAVDSTPGTQRVSSV